MYDGNISTKKGLVTRALDGELIIVDSASGYVHQLNSSAACIWEALESGATVTNVHSELVARYRIDDRSARQDVNQLLSQLVELGLIVTDIEQGGEHE